MSDPHLHSIIAKKAAQWKDDGFKHDHFPAIADILEYQLIGKNNELRWLRAAQVEALTVYWYLRLCEGTPHILDLYKTAHPEPAKFREAIGIATPALMQFMLDNGQTALDNGQAALFEKIKDDPDFAKTHKLEPLRESLLLDYPSYILALTMGAGKTALIAAIIATEFAMAMEYETLDDLDKDAHPFMLNALVFAPGKTILGSLRQIASIPYEKILPARHHKAFAARIKLIFTRDGDPDINVIRGDTYNVVITNTEKIRITKDSIRKGDLISRVASKEDDAKAELANRRLQAIASLPKLGVFSDEAHHTYGTNVEKTLKRVRQTIDYLHKQTDLVAVINTTGTPYLKKKPLLDVVFWYGLSQGIQDGILKQVSGNIHAYEFDDQSTDDFIAAIIEDFVKNYQNVQLPTGHPAKLAIYFPQTDDLAEFRPIIETKLTQLGLSPSIVITNTTKSSQAEIDAFNRLNEPTSPHRIILLVNKGTEGWDCPSLFATALARKLKTSNNFVLQAACRCLRQVPGNNHRASIYLSQDNQKTLNKELTDTYGETLLDINYTSSNSVSQKIILRKPKLPPLVIKKLITKVVKGDPPKGKLKLTLPQAEPEGSLTRQSFDLSDKTRHSEILTTSGHLEKVVTNPETLDLYTAATKLAAVFRLPSLPIKKQLTSLYPDSQIPVAHLPPLAEQIEAHTSHYTTETEEIEIALALVKPEGFDISTAPDGTTCYTAQISYPKSKEHLIKKLEEYAQLNQHDLSFHYTPYNFDSNPEAQYFEELLRKCNTNPDDIEDFYFTGALTSSSKTDFAVEYKDLDGKWRAYTPDFVIRKKNGKCIIIEIKKDDTTIRTDIENTEKGKPANTTEGRKHLALKAWQNLNPDKIKYQIEYMEADVLSPIIADRIKNYITSGN